MVFGCSSERVYVHGKNKNRAGMLSRGLSFSPHLNILKYLPFRAAA